MSYINLKIVIFSSVFGALLYCLSFFLPLIGGILSFFSPIPLCYAFTKTDKINLIVIFLLTCSLIFFLGGKINLFFYLIQFGIPTLIFFELINRGVKPLSSIWISAGLLILFLSGSLIIFTKFNLTKSYELVFNFVNTNFSLIIEMYKKMGLTSEELNQLTLRLRTFASFMAKILPALGIIFYASLFFMECGFIKKFNSNFNYNFLKIKFPFILVWFFILTGFGIIFFKRSFIWWILLNIFIIISFIFIIQGFAVFEFFMQKYKIPYFFKMMIYFLILFFQVLIIPIGVIGLFDNWLDFRKLNSFETKA